MISDFILYNTAEFISQQKSDFSENIITTYINVINFKIIFISKLNRLFASISYTIYVDTFLLFIGCQ